MKKCVINLAPFSTAVLATSVCAVLDEGFQQPIPQNLSLLIYLCPIEQTIPLLVNSYAASNTSSISRAAVVVLTSMVPDSSGQTLPGYPVLFVVNLLKGFKTTGCGDNQGGVGPPLFHLKNSETLLLPLNSGLDSSLLKEWTCQPKRRAAFWLRWGRGRRSNLGYDDRS